MPTEIEITVSWPTIACVIASIALWNLFPVVLDVLYHIVGVR
jgi:hypothetical protein